jgi:hypothetical protein
MPTVQGTDDFNHAIDAGYYTDAFFSPGAGNPEAVNSPLYRSQPKSLHITTAAGNSGVRHNITGAPTRGWAAFPLQVSALATAGDVMVAGFQSAATDVGRLHLGSSGLFLVNSTGTTGAEFAITPNTWYWVEMIFDVSGANHNVYGRVAGSDMTSPAAFSAGAGSSLDFHQLISLAGDTPALSEYFGMWEWGSAASNSDWLGEPSTGGRLGGAAALGF